MNVESADVKDKEIDREVLEIVDDKDETFNNLATSENDKGYTRKVRFTIYLEQKTELNNVDSK